MPIVVDPGVITTTPVVSSDGVLTVTPRPDLGAALVKVQFGSAAVNARTVTVTRDGVIVRGLDAHPAPSGVTGGIDAELPLGALSTYRASATAADGSTWTSTAAAVTVARPPNRAWLTCLSRPELSCLVTVVANGYPDWPLTGRVGQFSPLGSAYTSTGIGVPYWKGAQLTMMTKSVAEDIALETLLQIREPLLLQPDALQARRRPDDFVTVLGATPSQPGDVDPDVRVWAVSLARNERPPTAGSTVNLPGRTIGGLAAQYPTISALPTPPLRWLTG